MQMRYFRNSAGDVYGYDDQEEAQASLIAAAIENGWTDVTDAWPPAPSLDDVKAYQIASLNRAFANAGATPVTFTTAAGTTAQFLLSDDAKAFMAQAIAAGAKAWTINLWPDAANAPVTPFTFADLQGLSDAIKAATPPTFADLLAKIAAVNAAETVEAVQAITF